MDISIKILTEKVEWAKNEEAKNSFRKIQSEVLDELRESENRKRITNEKVDDESYNLVMDTPADFRINGVTFSGNEIEVNCQTVVFYFNFMNHKRNSLYTSVEVNHEDFSDIVFCGFI